MGKIFTVLSLILLCLVCIAEAADVQVSNLSIKEMKQDSIGYIWFSSKIDVYNDNIPGTVFVRVQGLDRDGFEVYNFLLSGRFNSNEHRALTNKNFMKPDEYDSVVEWVIQNVDKHPDR